MITKNLTTYSITSEEFFEIKEAVEATGVPNGEDAVFTVLNHLHVDVIDN